MIVHVFGGIRVSGEMSRMARGQVCFLQGARMLPVMKPRHEIGIRSLSKVKIYLFHGKTNNISKNVVQKFWCCLKFEFDSRDMQANIFHLKQHSSQFQFNTCDLFLFIARRVHVFHFLFSSPQNILSKGKRSIFSLECSNLLRSNKKK